ncbi:Major Facilitator Superfamily protein [Ruminococcaceae bacterium YAD3003]|nr:Major Facilitator Superfamily protein [Ruminococcaceae bacterium YAD3003]
MTKNNNYGKFLLLWAGEFISSIGGGLTSFGLGLYIFQKTGSATDMALLTLLGFLPSLVLRVPAGVLADRYDRRLLMMIGDGLSGLGVLFILICMLTGEASLWQIYLGTTISSIFSALLEPSYTATITDLLTKEQFSKANGLVSLAGSSRFLLSPIIAGFLLSVSDIKLILIIDVCTFFLTVIVAAVVRRGIKTSAPKEPEPFMKSMKEGWQAVSGKRGLLMLVVVSSLICLFMGMFQVLGEPFVLSFADSKTLGIVETIAATGMLVTSIVLGIKGIKKNFVRVLWIGLAVSGIGMSLFAICENIYVICFFGFVFFAALPFANNSLDYLVRTNIPAEMQGRAWGFIGFISQLGYVIAYGISGITADFIGKVTNKGVGGGSAITVIASGICLFIVALAMSGIKRIRELENTETPVNEIAEIKTQEG